MTVDDFLKIYREKQAPILGRDYIDGFIARNRASLVRMIEPVVALINARAAKAAAAKRVKAEAIVEVEDPDVVTPEKDAIVWAAFTGLVNEKRRAIGMEELKVTESLPFGGKSVGRIRDRGWGSEVAADRLTARSREMANTRHNAQMTGDHAAWSRRVSAKVGALLAARKRHHASPGSREAGLALESAEASLARELGGKEHVPLAIETYRWEQEQEQRRRSRNDEDVESLPRPGGRTVAAEQIFSNGKAARQIATQVPMAGTTATAKFERTIHAAACWLVVEGEADALYLSTGSNGSTMWRTTSGITTIADKTGSHAALAQAAKDRLWDDAQHRSEDVESLPGRAPIAIMLRHPKRRDLTAMVTASASEPGRFQLTWVDDEGPSGHTTRDTPEEAVRYAVDEGYRLDSANTAEARVMVERVQRAREERAAEIESWLTESLPSHGTCGRHAESIESLPKNAGRMGDGFRVGEHVIRIGDMIKMEGQLGGYVRSVDRGKGTAVIEQDNDEVKTWPIASLLHDTAANRQRQQDYNDKINADAEAQLERSLANWRAL